jgi:hypothetical protein
VETWQLVNDIPCLASEPHVGKYRVRMSSEKSSMSASSRLIKMMFGRGLLTPEFSSRLADAESASSPPAQTFEELEIPAAKTKQ